MEIVWPSGSAYTGVHHFIYAGRQKVDTRKKKNRKQPTKTSWLRNINGHISHNIMYTFPVNRIWASRTQHWPQRIPSTANHILKMNNIVPSKRRRKKSNLLRINVERKRKNKMNGIFNLLFGTGNLAYIHYCCGSRCFY